MCLIFEKGLKGFVRDARLSAHRTPRHTALRSARTIGPASRIMGERANMIAWGVAGNSSQMTYLIGVPRKDKQGCRFFAVDVSTGRDATKRGRELFLAEAPECEYDWNGAEVTDRRIEVFTDSHISIMLTDLLQNNVPPQVVLSIIEKHEEVGCYHITVSFNSGDESRIYYDGANPQRVRRPFIASSYQLDSLKGIAANRSVLV